jgi:hypothetical protein
LLLIFTIVCCGNIRKVCCKCLRLKLRFIHCPFRSTRENYGDAAIRYVELKREASKCVVKGRICPEHRIRSKAYTTEVMLDEDGENIITAFRKDCTASQGMNNFEVGL